MPISSKYLNYVRFGSMIGNKCFDMMETKTSLKHCFEHYIGRKGNALKPISGYRYSQA